MRSAAQMVRQPLKTLSGIILVALAVAILCVCVGQASAAANMRAAMEESYHTVALPTNKYQTGSIPQEVLDWIDKTVEENPDVILSDSHAGLASAYIPELHPDNYIRYVRPSSAVDSTNQNLLPETTGAPYTCAMLEITLTKVTLQELQESGGAVVVLKGTVENAVGLEQGYNDPTGYGVSVSLYIPDQDRMVELVNSLEIGQRYLTYGVDYVDRDWILRSSIAEDESGGGSGDGYSASALEGFVVEEFTPENLFFINGETEEEWQALIDSGNALKNVAYYRQDYIKEDGTPDYYLAVFTAWEMVQSYHKVSYTLWDFSEGTGNEKDQTPTIVKLEGTAEEFLASEEGALWAQALYDLQISNQSFPVVAVDDLMYIGEFATQDTAIVEGRDFTQEELDSGARVCVISDILAQRNGLSVGDVITAQFYDIDWDSPIQSYISQNQGVINPTARFFTSNTAFSGEPVEYTIVGLYSQRAVWDTTAENLYAFTPNTIFAPKASVSGEMDYSYMGMFRTLVLKNGSMAEFQALLSAGGVESLFECCDQGYSDLVDNLYSYDLIADQALRIGLIVYSVVILLYFLLFPTRQGKSIDTMSSLGATRWERLVHINVSGLVILIPGSVIGVAAGIALRQEVIDALTKTAAVALPLEMDIGSLMVIGAGQLALTAVLTGLISIPMSRNKSLMKRRGFLEKFKQLRRTPLYTWAVTGLALIVSLVLCSLNASNRAEYENYEKAKKEIPVTVTVTNPMGNRTTGLELKGWVADAMSGEYDWGLAEYLSDICVEMSQEITSVNGDTADRKLRGLMSVNCAAELLPVTNSAITWYEGYDESIFTGEEPVCIVPEGYTADADPATPEQELELYYYRLHRVTDSMGALISESEYTYEHTLTVVGTYVSTVGAQDIYCPYYVAKAAAARLQISPTLDSASATLKNNEDMEAFLETAYKYFLEPGPDADPKGYRQYGLKVEVGSLDKAEAVLNNSLTVNRISTLLVFVLSACAGFFVGFLMIRSRKREIALMRTLGKSNVGIYRDFALEQLGYILLGTVLGGAIFLWQPLKQLVWFVAVYFVGLSAALIVFLNSKLITNMKEDE